MSDQQPQKARSLLTNPQVITAIIGGIATLVAAILGILPGILNRPAEATAIVIVTATPLPATMTVIEPTALLADAPTAEVVTDSGATVVMLTATPVPLTAVPRPPASPRPANMLLLWDEVSFTAINLEADPLSLIGVTFESTEGSWDARAWGTSLYSSLPSRNCLRLRDATARQGNPPVDCDNVYGLMLVGTSAVFWRGADHFDVLRDGQVIATCSIPIGRCEVSL